MTENKYASHLDFIPQRERKAVQLNRLNDKIRQVYEKNSFYRDKFECVDYKIQEIGHLEDIEKLPFTSKEELSRQYPFGICSVPLDEIVEIHTSSGTKRTPVLGGYTRNDLKIWKEVMKRSLSLAGVTGQDILQNAYGYGLFTGGLGVHYGAQAIGAMVIPASGGNSKRQLELMRDLGTTVLACTPSYALYLSELLREGDMKKDQVKLRLGIFGAEPWSERIRSKLEERLNITALDIYGLTEIIGPGVAQECKYKSGLHIFEDHFYPEIISPEKLKVLPEGEEGELVITTLTREGMPIIRYRTGDVTSLARGKCECGRTIARIGRIKGRSDDMIKIRGVAVFPSQIEEALLTINDIEPHYQIFLTNPKYRDNIEVQVESSPELWKKQKSAVEAKQTEVEERINSRLGLRINASIVEPKKLIRSEGKIKRVVDLRRKE